MDYDTLVVELTFELPMGFNKDKTLAYQCLCVVLFKSAEVCLLVLRCHSFLQVVTV